MDPSCWSFRKAKAKSLQKGLQQTNPSNKLNRSQHNIKPAKLMSVSFTRHKCDESPPLPGRLTGNVPEGRQTDGLDVWLTNWFAGGQLV